MGEIRRHSKKHLIAMYNYLSDNRTFHEMKYSLGYGCEELEIIVATRYDCTIISCNGELTVYKHSEVNEFIDMYRKEINLPSPGKFIKLLKLEYDTEIIIKEN